MRHSRILSTEVDGAGGILRKDSHQEVGVHLCLGGEFSRRGYTGDLEVDGSV